MAFVDADLQGNVSHFHQRIMIDANVVDNQFLIRSTATNSAGEGVDPTTTGAADVFGIVARAVTYTATAADLLLPNDIRDGRCASVVIQPFALYKTIVSGGATAGTALNSTAPANILTTTGTSATVISAAEVGTATRVGGMLYGVTGNNAGQRRRISAWSSATSVTVEVPFRYAVAAGDVFIVLPWSMASQTVQLTSDLVQADGTIAAGTGAPFAVFRQTVDIVERSATIELVALDHFYNPA